MVTGPHPSSSCGPGLEGSACPGEPGASPPPLGLQEVAEDDDGQGFCIRSESFSASEAIQYRELLRIAILYTVGYLFEHREEADHHDLMLTLRNLLFAIREGVV